MANTCGLRILVPIPNIHPRMTERALGAKGRFLSAGSWKFLRLREINKNYAFWLGLVFCTVYQSYRYPLQINTVGFSPTYSETPLIWQGGKYVLALPLIAVSVVRWLSNSSRLTRWPIALEVKPVYAGLLIFGYFFAFGSFGLPFPLKFPINAMFFIFLFLVAFRKITADDHAIAPVNSQELAEARRKATCE